jgi:SAM-dependent methyltransferase
MATEQPYSDAVGSGQYAKRTGLDGKYDNVRRFWEDQATRLFLRKHIADLVQRKADELSRLKILDLGCGSGDGFELLMSITERDVGIYEYAVNLIKDEMLEHYMGIDINEDLLAQANEHYGYSEKIEFTRADFTDGLPIKDEDFDVYLTSYGTLSHNRDKVTVKLLSDIAEHARNKSIIILDWLGRYSYEWQDLWDSPATEETFMDYRISYIHPPEERETADIQSFPLRILTRAEAHGMIEEASRLSGIELKIRETFDRSIFVGRHIDTAEYNKNATPIRQAVNSLFEPNCRTDLHSLLVDYVPRKGHGEVNSFFEGFSQCWNALIRHTISFLDSYPDCPDPDGPFLSKYTFYPESLKQTVSTMSRVVRTTGDLPGDTRANIIEPQLAYALRKLEMDLQPGLGVAHGFCSVVEVVK